MTMDEFYKKYNLNKNYFAAMAGVGHKTLDKYAENKPIREASKERIENAMRVIEKYDLARPVYDHAKAFDWFGITYNMEFNCMIHDYERRFKKLMEQEL